MLEYVCVCVRVGEHSALSRFRVLELDGFSVV